MKTSITVATTALFFALGMGTAQAQKIENFEANYPVVQSVPGEAPAKGIALSPNHPSWPQIPAAQSVDSGKMSESLRGSNVDARESHYLA